MTDEELDALETLARAATPGERTATIYDHDAYFVILPWGVARWTMAAPNRADADFIAAATPETVLALCAEVKRLKALADSPSVVTVSPTPKNLAALQEALRQQGGLGGWVVTDKDGNVVADGK